MSQETDIRIANMIDVNGDSLCGNCGESLNQSLRLWTEQGLEVIKKNMEGIQKILTSFLLFEKGLSQTIELSQPPGFPLGYYICPKCGFKLCEDMPHQGIGDFS